MGGETHDFICTHARLPFPDAGQYSQQRYTRNLLIIGLEKHSQKEAIKELPLWSYLMNLQNFKQ